MSTLPIKLFFDCRSTARLGEENIFQWWLKNTGPDEISSVVLEPHQSTRSEFIRLNPYKRESMMLSPGSTSKCNTAFAVHRPGTQSVGMRVEVRMGRGRVVTFETVKDLEFHFESLTDKESRMIEVQGSAVVKSAPPPGTLLKISGNAIMNLSLTQDADKQPSGMALQLDELPVEQHLRELLLVECLPVGLNPVDFKTYAERWFADHRHRMRNLSFIDHSGLPFGGRLAKAHYIFEVPRETEYAIRVSSHMGGHLTMLARGTSGRFMPLAPTPEARLTVLAPQADHRLPGDLLELQRSASERSYIVFNDTGREQVLALVTPLPLLEQPMPLFDAQGNPVYLTEDVVRQLLSAALWLPGAELGFIEATVS